MNDVVNLNRFRKRSARDAKAVTAAENRVRFGQTKADREASQQSEAVARRRHEQHSIKHDPEKSEPVFRQDHASTKTREDEA